ncbi:MAG TPA: hypothetical protein VHZ55_10190 [Bryobacteraceae bacterium]|jgi:hypothetical protein|nr:hypothetical protein [Bryobacteraceae bacterium]
MAVKNSKILKVAGLSFVGFCAVSIGVDRANIGPVASQLAGFCGAFLGGWVGARRKRAVAPPPVSPPSAASSLASTAAESSEKNG